ncbi:pilus assembly protein [Brevundimonas sp. SORGH_AS_0993]|uniref:TadE/TadG family type IV pilus assembly protein n=1 Tax=Brevundimonas sp. SORGH_AS_0993 TaxID=3041794 RepID=UPI002788D38E|nr:pilus assembly protein [Brevundimonas sp. SORGH_AS_0993]MDQ1154126.1 Flp pilus assembly protein TadG [Brevundimonas sp. SORGH_AS_0993]
MIRRQATERARRFWLDREGNIAIMFALTAMALVIMIGMAIDVNRLVKVRSEVQQSLDAAALAAAASRAQTARELKNVADPYLHANLASEDLTSGWTTQTEYRDDRIVHLAFTGGVKPLFAGMVGINRFDLHLEAEATRGVAQRIEAVLVLDNTYSMIERDSRSIRRIDALKSSASLLVNELMTNPSDEVSIGVVPYADYVNVGTNNRGASWLSVPNDYVLERTCDTRTYYTGSDPYVCTSIRDGVAETGICYRTIVATEVKVPPYRCDISYKWYGCVYSRNVGSLRLTDQSPNTPYRGFLTTSQSCLNAITPLTRSKSTVLAAIDNLIINVGGYKPETHIPSGMIWGVNVLSPTPPFQQGTNYDPANRRPRKILVLMTDGVNTMTYRPWDGAHVATDSPTERAATDTDLTSICTYAKTKKIELFTVGLNVPTKAGRTLLKTCATDDAHAFLAEDSAGLESAFREIARSIGVVRLVK